MTATFGSWRDCITSISHDFIFHTSSSSSLSPRFFNSSSSYCKYSPSPMLRMPSLRQLGLGRGGDTQVSQRKDGTSGNPPPAHRDIALHRFLSSHVAVIESLTRHHRRRARFVVSSSGDASVRSVAMYKSTVRSLSQAASTLYNAISGELPGRVGYWSQTSTASAITSVQHLGRAHRLSRPHPILRRARHLSASTKLLIAAGRHCLHECTSSVLVVAAARRCSPLTLIDVPRSLSPSIAGCSPSVWCRACECSLVAPAPCN